MNATPFSPQSLPAFQTIDTATIVPQLREVIAQNKQQIMALLAKTNTYNWDNLLQPLEEMGDELQKMWSPISHLHSVLETDALRAAYNEALPLLTDYHTELSQNVALFKAIGAIATSSHFNQLNAAIQKIIENDIRDFKLAGVHLAADKKARFAELQKQLSQAMTTFSEHVLDATHAFTLHLTEKEIAGLPQQAQQLAAENAKLRKLDGYVITLDYPSYSTAIKFLQARELRKTLYEAYCTRASDRGPQAKQWDNTAVMDTILALRHEIATLVGFDNYAEYSLATKMAKKPEEVLGFLNDLLARSHPIAVLERDALTQFAKTVDGIDELAPWDIAYYSEKLCEQTFHFTQEDLRPYFPIDKVLAGFFAIVHQIYGIQLKKISGVSVWHEDVNFYAVYDEAETLIGGVYLDLYARPHKRDGAWMDECRVRRRLQDGSLQHPVAYLTCNFMPPVQGKPALLTHDDVLTVFHEFGHCLHHILTKVDYPSVAGINGVPWDAVEFPSQFMENYCWEKAALSLFAAHYETGAPLPDDLFQKMLNAKHFQAGLQMLRQIEFALFDFRLHLEYNPARANQVQSILNEVRQQAAVFPVAEFNRFQHSFSHIFAGGYAAGYYSYKWAEVLSADAYAKFEENGIFDRQTGRSYLQQILEVGGVRDPMTSFIAFRGHAPTIDALLKHNGMA